MTVQLRISSSPLCPVAFPAHNFVFNVHGGALHAVLDVIYAVLDSDGILACAGA